MRTWHSRWKAMIEDSHQLVFFFAGGGCLGGPTWLGLVAVGIWVVRALLLRAIWAHEDATEKERTE